MQINGSRQDGFTLVEVTISMAVATVLMGGLASGLVIASRAIPDSQSALSKTVVAYHSAQQIAGELYCATSFTERTPTAITFRVADRDNNLSPETIRYAWSGTPGDPLTRKYNAGAVVTVVQDVQEFDLSYVTRSATTTVDTVVTSLFEDALLASFEGWPGIPLPTVTDMPVNTNSWSAEFLMASSLPANTTNLSITRVQLRMKQGTLGGAGVFSVGIHRSKGGGNPEPSANPLGTPVAGTGLFLAASYGWAQFNFFDVSISNPSKDYVIVVKGTAGAGSDVLVERYNDGSAPKDDPVAMWTTDGGAQWSPKKNTQADYDFPFRIYGDFETKETVPQDVSSFWLQSVGITLRTGSDTSTRANTAVEILNQPEVTVP